MSRDLPAGLAEAFATPGTVTGIIALLGEFRFDSGTIGMWTGLGELEYNGVTYFGGGNLIGVSPYEETLDLQAKGLTLTLSGIASDLIEIAENEPYQNRVFKMYIGLIDVESYLAKEDETGHITLENGSKIILKSSLNDIQPFFSGLMDVMDTTDAADSSTIQLSVENVLTVLQRAKTRRYTDQDQKSRYPLDTGLSFIAGLQDKELVW